MRQYKLLITLLLSMAMGTAHAGGRLGIVLAPSFSVSRVYADPNNTDFSPAGISLRYKLGLIYDVCVLRDNYFISTGLMYSNQHLALKNQSILPNVQEKHALQYLQVPVLLKLYTDEFQLDTRAYVTLGVITQVRLSVRNVKLIGERRAPFIQSFHPWSMAWTLGTGIEYATSVSTNVFVGLSYQGGVRSIIATSEQLPFSTKTLGYTDLWSINLGVRF